MTVVRGGYLANRRTACSRRRVPRTERGLRARAVSDGKCFRDWWLVRYHSTILLRVSLPKKYWGKRVRFRVEVMK